ncbi:MAG TPA: alpha/beta fold hydrolase, partial [Candidatus Goldiibacteriota bacterium]|nr:alpha/beta fold hydrolase [Candidatus Goldiibacteriota bacterium]
ISCYAIELEGFGELSGGREGHISSMKKYHEALRTLKLAAAAENPGKPVFILGESMGGLIATYHVLYHDADFKGLISIAPAYKDVLKISALNRLRIFLESLVNGSAREQMPFTNSELTSDPEILAKLDADKREHKKASASLLRGNLMEQAGVILGIGRLKVPLLLLLAGRDRLVDTPFAIKLFHKVKGDKKYILYPDSLHALTIEKNREEVFSDIVKWLEKRV